MSQDTGSKVAIHQSNLVSVRQALLLLLRNNEKKMKRYRRLCSANDFVHFSRQVRDDDSDDIESTKDTNR